MKIPLLSAIVCLPLLSMDNEQEQPVKIQKTENRVSWELKTTDNQELMATKLDTLIMEGSVEDFKSNIQLDELSYEQLDHLRSTIFLRNEAIKIVQKSVGILGDHVDQIKDAIKKMPKKQHKPGTMGDFDLYLKNEEKKLVAIGALVDAEFNQYTQQWFMNGPRMGYTVTKQESKN